MNCNIPTAIFAYIKNYSDLQFNRYVISYILISFSCITIGIFYPFMQILLTMIVLFKIDHFKLFISNYFPESTIVKLNISYLDEMCYAKLPMLVFFVINSYRCMRNIYLDFQSTQLAQQSEDSQLIAKKKD
ncbi:hypothetical protein SS50377_23785 [Spironucleus salmonicida]|uniref:Transmembrane protein n=1 Tax=Spironucleus salmonicida TaxID=348837 RepID=V6LQD8_9EUKA|nr:hypothetical protein SS50377_23785 [Spironucleus salmonicida]|eukprot:EST46463.1 Hypothetical protein SS50377_13545 [Spironucleus salmonicida]